jgi:hypothetical protein
MTPPCPIDGRQKMIGSTKTAKRIAEARTSVKLKSVKLSGILKNSKGAAG